MKMIHLVLPILIITTQLFAGVETELTLVSKKQRKRVHKDIVGKWYSRYSMQFTKDGYYINHYKGDTLGTYDIDPSMTLTVTEPEDRYSFKIRTFNPMVMTVVNEFFYEPVVQYKEIDEIKDLNKKIRGEWVQLQYRPDPALRKELLIRNDTIFEYMNQVETTFKAVQFEYGGVHGVSFRENGEMETLPLALYNDTLYLGSETFYRSPAPLKRKPIAIDFKTPLPELELYKCAPYRDTPGIIDQLRTLEPKFSRWCYGNAKELTLNTNYTAEFKEFLERDDVKDILGWYKIVSSTFNSTIKSSYGDQGRLFIVNEEPAVIGDNIAAFRISPSQLEYERNVCNIEITLSENAKTELDEENRYSVKPRYAVVINGDLYSTFIYETVDEESFDDLPKILSTKFRYGYKSTWKSAWSEFLTKTHLEKYNTVSGVEIYR